MKADAKYKATGKRMVSMDEIMHFSLNLTAKQVYRKSQVCMNVERRTQKFHCDKISAVIIFK